MAKIIGGIGASHTPTIGFAHDQGKHNDPVWQPIFAGFAPVKQWLAEKKPAAAFVIYNDHISSFFFDHYSPFALGVDVQYHAADEGGGARAVPAIAGQAELARHIAASLSVDGFDLSTFQRKGLDHGCFSPLSLMFDYQNGWPVPIVPLQVGVLQAPSPSAARCFALGKALRRAIESYPQEMDVVIIATGGLSHQVHGERCGFNNPEWDAQFLHLIAHQPQEIADMTLAELATRGGYESAEVVMWLIMRGALSDEVNVLHQSYCLPSMTGIATLILENQAPALTPQQQVFQHEKMQHDMQGATELPGTYPYDLKRASDTYRLNNFLHQLTQTHARAAFRHDAEKAYADAQLTEIEKQLLRARDWRGLIRYGVIFFLLEKFAAVLGLSNMDIYAAMRGQTVSEFAATRNAPSARYSVAGADSAQTSK